MLLQIGIKIHGFIHDTSTTHNADFVESFDVIWEKACRDIFSMVDYSIRAEYACYKRNFYDSPPSSNDDHQRASPHDLCLQHIDALMHDLGIHNIFTKSITKKLFFHIIQVKNRTRWIHFFIISLISILEGWFSPWGFSSFLILHGQKKNCCKRWLEP